MIFYFSSLESKANVIFMNILPFLGGYKTPNSVLFMDNYVPFFSSLPHAP